MAFGRRYVVNCLLVYLFFTLFFLWKNNVMPATLLSSFRWQFLWNVFSHQTRCVILVGSKKSQLFMNFGGGGRCMCESKFQLNFPVFEISQIFSEIKLFIFMTFIFMKIMLKIDVHIMTSLLMYISPVWRCQFSRYLKFSLKLNWLVENWIFTCDSRVEF